MSASRSFSVSHRSGKSSISRAAAPRDFTALPTAMDVKYFVPCAATASRFLYAQGSSVVCCHHDKLTIEHTFFRHSDEIQLLAVDNISDHGAGRLAVSYDAGQTAIVWDLVTGDEMSRFASYEHLTTAAWMRNGNVAFGNTQGNIILFEPTTSEHISSRTIDQIAITALAPSADCRTFAIGYSNGSLLVATLQPRFTILHNLNTSKAPSPIVTLAWHASSTRSKTDMLAVQTHDGDLRVWSVSKVFKQEDPAKVVRILRRNENCFTGPNWMGWSKNGRVIQFSDSETLSWDVRTKHVTHDSIPTLTDVKGIAVYGPGATLFTIGPNNTVQQFDLNSPAIMVANVQHPAGLLPPSPPTSEEIARSQSATTIHTSESESSSIHKGITSESDDDDPDPFAHLMTQQMPAAGYVPYNLNQGGLSSLSKTSTGSRTPGQRQARSLRSRGLTEVTHISAGSGLQSSTLGKRTENHWGGSSLPSIPSSASSRSRHQPSSLRHEVPRSPDDDGNTILQELFKYTRCRLTDIPYKHFIAPSESRLTNDDLRRQMLGTIFGWHGEVQELIRDEMSRHSVGSANRILLGKWLGDLDGDMMISGLRHMTTSDWMLLALSGIGKESQQNLLRAYVQRLLENQDLHIAVTIMIGLGEFNDGIEIYVSHKRYMEALILTGLIFPSVWERQAAIIRKWGEWAVQHGQQQLAIRCFACTGQESSEPWTSPSATQLNFQGISASIPEILSPPRSPFVTRQGPKRSIAKTSALTVITSFGNQNDKAKLYSQLDGGQTPIAAGVTPILDSALSPHGGVELTATALHRPSSSSRFNTPTTAHPSGPNFGRGRLSSIGETPSDLNRNGLIEQTTRSRTGSLTSASSTNRSLKPHHRQRERNGSIQSLQSQEAAQLHPKKDSKRPGSTDRVRGSVSSRHKSSERRGYSRDPSEERGRSSARLWEKPKRSPTSPVPMSPKDLAVLGKSKHSGFVIEPLPMRKAHSVKGGKTSRASSRGSRRSSDGRARPSVSDIRGTSKARAYSPSRSPSPPPALSAKAMYYQDSEDEQDYEKAMQAQEEFRAKHSQSASRGLTSPTSSRHEFPQIHGTDVSELGDVFVTTTPHVLRAASTEQAGDLRRMKMEGQAKKEKAARELEERRRSLAKRQHITTIPHPSEIAVTRLPAAMEADEERFPEGLPPRSATEPPEKMHRPSKQHRAHSPESSKAMRSHLSLGDHFRLDLGDQTKDAPSIPSVLAREGLSNVDPKGKQEPTLTLLPSTVYQPPPSHPIVRSMSAPIPDDVFASSHQYQHHHRETGSIGETRGLGHILEDRIDEEEQTEQTPMTLLPPRLKELQHLAIPPPPPPPPLPNMPRSSNGGGAFGSGMIEIVVDEDDAEKPAVVPPNDGMVPVLPLPVAPIRGHERRRSNGDGSLSGRSFRMTDLVHSVSRSRKNSVKAQHVDAPTDLAALNQLRSPTSGAPPAVAMYDQGAFRSPFEPHRRNNSERGMF